MNVFSHLPTGLTFDDVLLIPQLSPVSSRNHVSVKTNITPKISLNIPFIPTNMDTVTESLMAISVAHEGSLGIIHRFMSVEREVEEIKKVKRTEDLILHHPLILHPNQTLGDVYFQIDRYQVSSFLITDEKGKLLGILTKRDYQLENNLSLKVEKLMTPFSRLITAPNSTTLSEAKKILISHRIEKLPLINPDRTIAGLYTVKDIVRYESNPLATRDEQGNLRVGASVGATNDYMDRAIELDKVGADLILVDVAHCHAKHILQSLKKLRKRLPHQEIIAGNIATSEAALDLIKTGIDAIKVGIGPGSVCTTRIMAGVGVPQLSAIFETAKVCHKHHIPVIADGGAKNSGDIVKALAAGADIVMAGNLFAGTDEAPGDVIKLNGKTYKSYRGSSTYSTAVARNSKGDFGKLAKHQEKHIEGAEALMPYKGPVHHVISSLLGGITSGFSYCGAGNISSLRKNAKFILVTANGIRENNHHDVIVS